VSDPSHAFLSHDAAARLSDLVDKMVRYTEQLADTSNPEERQAIWQNYQEAESEFYRRLPPAARDQ
jgi:hypothetical protein